MKKIKKSLPTKVLITSANSTNPNFMVREESFIKGLFTMEIGLTANVKAKENSILCNLTTLSKVINFLFRKIYKWTKELERNLYPKSWRENLCVLRRV